MDSQNGRGSCVEADQNADFPNHERSPLLSGAAQHEPSLSSMPSKKGSFSKKEVYLLLVIVAGLDFTVFTLNLPLTRVYESILCYHYYAAHEPGQYDDSSLIPEKFCKGGSIQEELAVVRGFEFFFMSIPGILLALPYGTLADRWGRKPVLLLCALGLALSMTAVLMVCWLWWIFPLRFVWIAWCFTTVGGGASVLMATTFTMLTDLTNESNR